MRHSSRLSKALHTLILASVLVAIRGLGLAIPAPVMAQTRVPLGSFRSIVLRSGGEVVVRHGSDHRVTLLEGSTDYTSLSIVDGDMLVIDRQPVDRPRGYKVTVEVVTPEIDHVAVLDAGTIQCRGNFPRQTALRATVQHGGTIDLRSLIVDDVVAGVRHGGRILTRPRSSLDASVAQGGVVTYWGNPRVVKSIEHGGAIARGRSGDAEKPLSQF